jgi:hypothetical protein
MLPCNKGMQHLFDCFSCHSIKNNLRSIEIGKLFFQQFQIANQFLIKTFHLCSKALSEGNKRNAI